ncbi:MAG: hypothetical protein P1P76_02735 [Anaerolineales bacterium]|nr:hypothetical protein [Anaerolineales bacterium]
MLTFREHYGWNLALLVGFSGALGALFSSLSIGWVPTVGYRPFLIVLLSLIVAGLGRRSMGTRSGEFGVILWIVSWAYLMGWGVLIILRLEPVFYLTWSVVGLLLFTALAAVWFANLEGHLRGRSGVSAAIDLYLISLNLYLAAVILQSTQI